MNEDMKFGVYVHNDVEINFNFKTSLNARNKIKFVNSVTETLVDDNYNYIVKDMIFDFAIVEFFTDIDTSFVDDDPINMIDDFLYNSNIVNIVKENAEAGLIDDLRRAVDYNIEYRTGIHRNMIEESLSSLINTFEMKVADIDFEEIMEMSQMLSGMSGELTADKILDAYAKSDMYKSKNRKPSKKSNGGKGGKKSATTPLLSPEYEV